MGKILAHELAHVIGVQHDGEGNACDGKISAHRSESASSQPTISRIGESIKRNMA